MPNAPLSGPDRPLVIVGAGPAGLTAALELARIGVKVLVLEAGPRVGGLSQTVEHNGFRFDIGGHRFFSKIPAVTGPRGCGMAVRTGAGSISCASSSVRAWV